jgi:hypothetical protein
LPLDDLPVDDFVPAAFPVVGDFLPPAELAAAAFVATAAFTGVEGTVVVVGGTVVVVVGGTVVVVVGGTVVVVVGGTVVVVVGGTVVVVVTTDVSGSAVADTSPAGDTATT